MDIHEDALEGQDEARRKKREREEAEQVRLEGFKQQVIQNKVKQLMAQKAAEVAEKAKKKAKRGSNKPQEGGAHGGSPSKDDLSLTTSKSCS